MANAWNPQSPAIKTETVAYLKQAVKEGAIMEVHVKDVENGTITTDRLLGLFITIEQRRKPK